MKITQMDFPEKSLLFPGRDKYDYIDSFGGVFDDEHNAIGIDDIVDAFVSPLPRWIGVLMNVRNKIVSLAGLKTGNNTHGIV
ncbi:MAG TPA: hypothetical protein VK470_07320, partial [Bacteroidota bacterium]|nr:hypothetical protein [Bacteroidota bacterium]